MKLKVDVLNSIVCKDSSYEVQPQSARETKNLLNHSFINSPTTPHITTINIPTPKKVTPTIFELLYTDKGFHNIKKWFLLNTTNLDSTINETQFTAILRKLADISEYRMLEIFDLIDFEDVGRIGFSEFFLVISLFAAQTTAQCTQFLHRHSKQVFEILSNNGKKIDYNKFVCLGCLVDVSEYSIVSFFQELDLHPGNAITDEEFTIYCFSLLDALDKDIQECRKEGCTYSHFIF